MAKTLVAGKLGPIFKGSEILEPVTISEAQQLIVETDLLIVKRLAGTVIGLNRELELVRSGSETNHGFTHK